MNSFKIIGLLAHARSGKDTVADYIIDKYPEYNIVKRRLSGPVKNAVKQLYGFSDKYLETGLKDIHIKKYGCSPRDAMVHITNTIMNLSGVGFFTDILYDTIGKNELTIIPDIRYPHDVELISKRSGIVIKIVRDSSCKEDNIDNMMYDFIITNNGSLEQLYEQVDTIMKLFNSTTMKN